MFETEQHDMLLEDLLKSFVSATYDSQRTQGVFKEFMINSEINSVSSGQTKWRKSSSEKVNENVGNALIETIPNELLRATLKKKTKGLRPFSLRIILVLFLFFTILLEVPYLGKNSLDPLHILLVS